MQLGINVVQAGSGIVAKIIEALLALINKIYEIWKNAPERKLNKLKVKEAKNEFERKNLIEKIEGKAGFVKHEDLIKAGVPLTVTDISLTKKEFKELVAHCKREGIIISALVDSRELTLNNRKNYIVECKQEDLHKIAKLIDLMNDEKRIEFIDNKMMDILSKGKENLSEQDKIDLEELRRQRKNIQEGHCYDFNDKQADGIIATAMRDDSKAKISFDEAINRITGKKIDKDAKYIIADAIDPTKHIVCHSYMDTYKNQPYIKTNYWVFNDKTQVYHTHDGRFDGRPLGYWDTQKNAMRTAGGIGDHVFKFYDAAEYERFVQNYLTQNATKLGHLNNNEQWKSRDFSVIQASLEGQLSKNRSEAGNVNETNTVLAESRDAEANLINKQISVYKDLEKYENQVSITYAQMLAAQGTPEFSKYIDEYNKVHKNYQVALQEEAKLIKERKMINAVQAEQLSRVEAPVVLENTKLNELETGNRLDKTTNMLRSDEKRDERISEVNDKNKHSMVDYHGQIQDDRSVQGSKGMDAVDKEVNKELNMKNSPMKHIR